MKKVLLVVGLVWVFVSNSAFSKGAMEDMRTVQLERNTSPENQDDKFSRELSNKIKVDYDKYDNVTNISNEMSFSDGTFQLKGPKGEGTGLNLWILIGFTGKHSSNKKPDIILGFTHIGNDGWDYLDCHDLGLLINGKVTDFGELKHGGDVLTGAAVSEYMNMHLTYKQFLKLMTAKTVEGKICNTEFVFGDIHVWTLKKINELYKSQN